MAGRLLKSEEALIAEGYDRPEMVRRRAVLRETLDRFGHSQLQRQFDQVATSNLRCWNERSSVETPRGETVVKAGDWGEVTLELTMKYGKCFAVLNMANAYFPGGGYIEGMVAQEENMYRRTNCHFHIRDAQFDVGTGMYLPAMTNLLSGVDGRVYLDVDWPRVCIRGPEDRTREDLGYDWLPNNMIFPFFELRAAAQDLRQGANFDVGDARSRIAAQLDTLRDANIEYAVLGAFGCGAFQNPTGAVARLYREEIDKRRDDFALLAFAIFAAGYGPDNYEPFKAALG